VSPTGLGTLLIVVALTLGAGVVTVIGWRRPFLRTPRRALGLASVQVLLAVSVLVVVNRDSGFFPRWGDLIGNQPGLTTVRADVRRSTRELPRLLRTEHPPGGGLLLPWQLAVPGQTRTVRTLVYLPAAYFRNPIRIFPVVELLSTPPGGPEVWTRTLRLAQSVAAEIARHRVAPFVALLPAVDANGPLCGSGDVLLTTGVRLGLAAAFRVRTDARGWAVAGYAQAGACAATLALEHPDLFAAGASIAGVYGSSAALHGITHRHAPDDPFVALARRPAIDLLLAAARRDLSTYAQLRRLAAAARAPTTVDTFVLRSGGHGPPVWLAVEPLVLDWLSAEIGPPLAPPLVPAGNTGGASGT